MNIQWMTRFSNKAVKAFVALLVLAFPITQSGYGEKLDQSGIFDNTVATAFPQTKVASMVKEHFRSPLPAGALLKTIFYIPSKNFQHH